METDFVKAVNGSNRVQILEIPQAAPAHCAICFHPGGGGRTFVDWDFSLEFYGAVIVCNECVLTIMNGLEWISPEQWQVVKRIQEETLDLLQKEKAENAKLRSALDSLSFLPSISDDSGSDPEISQQPIEVKGPDNSGSDEPVDERRSPDIPDPDPDETFIKFT
jgi:hypothetical protein